MTDRKKPHFNKRNRIESYIWIGITSYYQGNYARARRAFTKAIRLCPNNPRLHKLRGEFFEAIGNMKAARLDFDTADFLCA